MSMFHAAILTGSLDMVHNISSIGYGGYDAGALLSVLRLSMRNDNWTPTFNRLLRSRPCGKPVENREALAISLACHYDNPTLLKDLLNHIPMPTKVICSSWYPLGSCDHYDGEHLPYIRLREPEDNHIEAIEFRRVHGFYRTSPLLFAFRSPLCRAILLANNCAPDEDILALSADSGDFELVQELWKYYDRRNNNPSRRQSSPLYYATAHGDIQMMQYLLDHDENINGLGFEYETETTATSLQCAIENLSLPAINLLLENGADVNMPAIGPMGESALQSACRAGCLGIAQRLIDGKGEPDSRLNAHALPRIGMSTKTHVPANVNTPRAKNKGRTALEGAAESGRIDTLQFLLNRGANTVGQGRVQYIRAIVLAERRGHATTAKMLRSHQSHHELDWSPNGKNTALYELLAALDEELFKISFEEDPGNTESDIDWNDRLEEMKSEMKHKKEKSGGWLDSLAYDDDRGDSAWEMDSDDEYEFPKPPKEERSELKRICQELMVY